MGHGGEQHTVAGGTCSRMEGEATVARVSVTKEPEFIYSEGSIRYQADKVQFIFSNGQGLRENVTVVLHTSPTNTLNCRHCSTTWCRHIQWMVNEHVDAHLLYSQGVEPNGLTLKVPIMPTEDIWADVMFGNFHDATQARAIFIKDPTGDDPSQSLRFLGFLSPGEGRGTVRTMVFDWFRGWAPTQDFQCLVSAHGFREQVALDKAMCADDKSWLLNNWSLWQEGRCWMCEQAMNNLADTSVF